MHDWQGMMGIKLTSGQEALFDQYYTLLIEGNSRMNLTAITEPEAVAIRHFADALSAEHLIRRGARVLDLGSGAGIPGIPLAIRRPDAAFLLLDSLNKRVGFLNETAAALGLSNVKAVHGRAEDLIQKRRETFDIGTARAVAPLNVLLELLLPFVKVGGRLIAFKGPTADEEVAGAKIALQTLGGLVESIEDVAIAGLSHRLVVVKKVAKSPEKYPRKAGTPAKEPIS